MAQIFPFQAYRYNPGRVELARVLTQPYDKIMPAMQERYYGLDAHNLITIEKGKSRPDDAPSNNVYTRAAEALREWIAEDVLVRDPAPSIYVYSQDYAVPHSGERKTRKGFIALGRIEDYAAGVVHRHEQTLSGPKADRLELLRHTRAHTGQLFMLYADGEYRVETLLEQASRALAPVVVRDEYDVVHRLWPIADAAILAQFQKAMTDKKLVIADGHHRYETALAYRDECRAKAAAADPDAPHRFASRWNRDGSLTASEKVMMTFFDTQGEGLIILPTHRVVSGLGDFQWKAFRQHMEAYFETSSYAVNGEEQRARSLDALRRHMQKHQRTQRMIGIYGGRNTWPEERAFFLFTLRRDVDLAALLPDVSPAQRQLDVVLLHRVVLEQGLGVTAEAVRAEKNITYEREMDAAIAAVDQGAAQLCCLLNPVRVEQVVEMALGGEALPQKSTDFYPKLLSGLTIYRLDG